MTLASSPLWLCDAAQRAFHESEAALEPARKVHKEATARWTAECEHKEKDIAKLYKRIAELEAKADELEAK